MSLKTKLKNASLIVFLQELIKNPSHVGAVCPSSKGLARKLARQIPLASEKYIVELGAGTGVVTEALLEQGVNPDRIIVIERSHRLAAHLRARLPNLHVIEGDAEQLVALVVDYQDKIGSIISSLPLRSLPDKKVKNIVRQIEALLKKGSVFIQYTYSWRMHSTFFSKKIQRLYSKYVWFNIPPARIDVFSKKT